MKLLKGVLLTLCFVSLLFALVSCGETDSLRIEADKTTAKPGEVVTFSTFHVTQKGEALTDAVTYEITAGAENATLSGNKLTIAATAKNGATITVVSKMDELVSAEKTITVKIPENSISISAEKTTLQRGENTTISVFLSEDGEAISADGADLTIIKGADAATLVGTKLTVKDDAANGTEIEVVATYKQLTSNTVKFTVSVPITNITVSASKSFIPAGSFATLQKVVSPVGAVGNIEWVVTEGADICTVSGDIIAVNANATNGATIKVKAKCGDIESNELTFTVGDEEEKFYLSLSQNNLTVDRNGTSATLLDVEIMNSKLETVTDRTVSFEIISGAEFLSITPNGNACEFTALGHGEAVVRVSLPGTNVSKNATVKVIVPPEAVKLPDMFVERLGLDYNISMIDPGTAEPDRLIFDAMALGTNVCTNLKYFFEHEDGTTGDSVATWADGKITFKKTGRVTLTVSSDSGSRNEVSTSYVFQVNDGYNVSTFEELKSLLQSNTYNGEVVNIVVTEKPVGANNYAYGYDLVPAVALKNADEQTVNEILTSHIYVKNKNVYINGNKHKIDGSQLRVVSEDELDVLASQGQQIVYIEALLMITPDANDPAQLAGKQHSAKIYDLEVVGNTPVDFDGELNGFRPQGSYNTGICIGNVLYDVVYHVEMKNVTSSRFNVGLRFRHVVGDSTIDNIKVYNCFSNGIETEATILTFGDMTIGKCGAAGLEMVPTNSDRAGDKMNETQKITFAGTMDTTQNLNKGDTRYFENYKVMSYTVPMVLGAIMQEYQAAPTAISHMMNENGEFAFVTFIFHDIGTMAINKSEAIYPAYQEGGIIRASELPTDGSIDTTHEYILLDIKLGEYNLGSALLYNQNYGK